MSCPSRRAVLRASVLILTCGIAGCTASPRPGDVTEYDSLTADGKRLFKRMLANGSIERPSDKIPAPLWEAEYVRYHDTTYAISKTATDRNIATYTLESVSVTKSAVNSSELIAYHSLSSDAQNAFHQTIDGGRYTARGRSLPGNLDEITFVEYDERYYKLRIAVGDIRIWRCSATATRN